LLSTSRAPTTSTTGSTSSQLFYEKPRQTRTPPSGHGFSIAEPTVEAHVKQIFHNLRIAQALAVLAFLRASRPPE
jgi:hypothetical protein